MKEDFVSIKPMHPQLKPWIAYYYFHTVANEGGDYSVIYYPHYHTAINFYRNAEVQWDDEGRIVRHRTQASTKCLFTRNTKLSRHVTLKGSVDKIGIVFNPLGINHFIACELAHISKGVITPFDYFGTSFLALSTQLFETYEPVTKRNLLDRFFLKRYAGFQDTAFRELVGLLMETKVPVAVNDIAQQMGIHRKTVLRKFKRYLGMSPSEFIALLKFRHAMHQCDSQRHLTRIAYDSNYYDQSHFIKNYKSLVGVSPKKLFSNVSVLGANNTIWTKLK